MKNKIYNAINITLGNMIINKIPSRSIRKVYYKLMGMKIKKNSVIFRRSDVLAPNKIEIGENCAIGWFTHLDGRGGIKIGNNTNISSYAKIVTGTHDIDSNDFVKGCFKQVVIGDNVWICTGALILPGVKIGNGAVVAAGAVVNKDVGPYEVVGGVPAKKIRERKNKVSYKLPKATILH